jgi:hypothetical protein
MKCKFKISCFLDVLGFYLLFNPKAFFIAVNNVYIQKHCFDVKKYYRDFIRARK